MNDEKDVFVIMPFSSTNTCTEAEWAEIYENVFRPAIEECGYSCERAQPMTGSLARSIVEKLRRSRIVLADITDRNANVFYELGVRHSLSKRTIIVAQGDAHTPSDLLGYWHISYGTTPGQVTLFKKEIRRLIAEIESEPDRSDNPVSDYLEQENLNVSTYVQKENAKKLGALYTECTGNLIHLGSVSADPYAHSYISYDCLKLLLQTMYVDVGPELLKVAYELYYKLRNIERGYTDAGYVESAIGDLKYLAEEAVAVRNKLISGQYEEPSTISTMAWRPNWANPVSRAGEWTRLEGSRPTGKTIAALICSHTNELFSRSIPRRLFRPVEAPSQECIVDAPTPESIKFLRTLSEEIKGRVEKSPALASIYEKPLHSSPFPKEEKVKSAPETEGSKPSAVKKNKAAVVGKKRRGQVKRG